MASYRKSLKAPLCVFITWMAVLFCSSTNAGTLSPWKDNRAAPTLHSTNLVGNLRNLEDLRGTVVLVNFWATWCPPCVIEMPSMQWLSDHFDQSDFHILAVNMSEPKFKVWKFIQGIGTDFEVLLDENGTAAADWNAVVLPASFIIDKSGNIRYYAIGLIDWKEQSVVETIESLLTE